MMKLKPLVAMQLRDKLDISYLKNWKTILFKTIFATVKFVAITAIIYIGFVLLSYLRLISLLKGIPDSFLLVVFTLMMFLSILTCTIGLVKSLYYAKDNQLLLTMPTNRVNIFFSKLIVYYIYELIRNITYILPVLIAFGLVNSYSFLYFIWILFALIPLTALPVIIAALLSIPAMYISNFFRNFKVLQYILITILIASGVFAVVAVINKIPANFDLVESWGTTFWQIQDFLNKFGEIFLPFKWLLISIVGTRYGVSHTLLDTKQLLYTLGVFGFILVMISICYIVVRPLFFKIASSPFEFKKSDIKVKGKNKKRSGLLAGLSKEIKLIFRNPEKLYPLLGVAVGMPIAILLLNKIFNAMDTRLTGTYMTITFNVLMIMLFALASSTTIAKVYSEEGHSAYLMKTNPQPYIKSLIAKIIPNAVVMTLSILATCIVFGSFAKSFVSVPLLFITIEAFYLGHLCWSAELDIMNPQTAQYATTGTHTNNPNEVKATLYGFILSIFVAFITYFIIGEGATKFWLKISTVGLAFLAMRVYFYVLKIKVYYKEK